MAELTDFGFERQNRTDITNRLNTSFRNKFGANLLLTDDAIAGLIRSLMAERELEWEKLLEDVYYSRTLNGAEGIALDDAASYFGIIRQGKQAGSGEAHIEFLDNGANLGTAVTTSDTFTGSNGLTYQVTSGGTLNTHITGAVIDVNALTVGDYTFFITNTINGLVEESKITLSGTSNGDLLDFADSLTLFITRSTEGNDSSILYADGILYIGYASSEVYIGLAQPVYFESVDLPSGFTYWSGFDVIATVTGYNPLPADGISSFINTFPGYVSATNPTDFGPGAENETDAEFRIRIQTRELNTPAGTRDSVAMAVSKLSNVISYRIYDNPTPVDRVEADALSFNTVVRGGSNTAVAKAIYDNKPINVNTSGITVVAISTADGQTENIFFTEASEAPYSMKVVYRVNNTSPLSSLEQASIRDSVQGLLTSQPLGLGVSNSQLASAVLVALPAGRLLSVQVLLKRPSDGPTEYSEIDISAGFDQFVSIEDFEFERMA